MHIPNRIPGLKLATAVAGLYFFVWIALEGVVWQTVLCAGLATAVALLQLLQKYRAGRQWGLLGWLLLTAVAGLLAGGLLPWLTLFFMALKTGLHAHGPEFSPAEMEWVIAQARLWTAVGFFMGLGSGLISWGVRPSDNNLPAQNELRP